ncbi:hypothetical protein ACFQU2_23650 [Siccirubricoccus deserti]
MADIGGETVAATDYFLRTVKLVVEAGTAQAGLSRIALIDTGEARACPGHTTRRMVNQIPARPAPSRRATSVPSPTAAASAGRRNAGRCRPPSSTA